MSVLGLLLFGLVGFISFVSTLRAKGKVAMVLTPSGLELNYESRRPFMPWKDIEKEGIVSIFNNKYAGLRLNSYDSYLQDMPPSLVKQQLKLLAYLKPLFKAMPLFELLADVPPVIRLWSKLEGHDLNSLKSFGDVGNLVEAFLWSRKTFGFDILIPWAALDRPVAEFVSLLEKYRTQSA